MRTFFDVTGTACLVAVTAVAAVVCVVPAANASARRSRIYVPQLAGKAQYKPSEISFSGDSGNVWRIRRWLSYGGRTAAAVAVTSRDDCNPNCASGHHTTASTHVQLSGLFTCGSRAAYAWFEVISTTRRSVAPVGEIQSLENVCPGTHRPTDIMDFVSPSGGIDCELTIGSLGRSAYCQTVTPPRTARLNAAGRTKICIGMNCLANGPEDALVLAYGASVALGPFRCASHRTGMRCLVRATGRGFQINRQGVTRPAAGAGGSSAVALPRVVSCTGRPMSRPTDLVVLACADANADFSGTRWLSWGARLAVGTTTFGLDLCTPTCAASRMTYFPASRVRLDEPKATGHGLFFSRATITYRLHGRTRTFVGYLPVGRQ